VGWLFKQIRSFAAVVGCWSLVGSARAQGSAPPDWLASKVNESGQHCARFAEHREADKLFFACGAAGVWEFALGSAAPRFVRSYAFAGEAVGFINESDGHLWVKLQVLEARPLSAASGQAAAAFPELAPNAAAAVPASPVANSPTSAAPALTPAAAPPAANRVGRVVSASAGEVVISLGTANGIMRGDHIELSLGTGENVNDDTELSLEVVAIGVVTNAGAESARVRLGLNESVPEGATATLTHAPTSSSLSAPPRVSGLWGVEFGLRPFVALDELGGGALISGSIGYRFSHLHLQAVLDPLAFGAVQTKDAVAAVNAALIASYDSQYLEMGLGFGAQTVNEAAFLQSPGSGLSVVQLVRLGARDGLNISARTSIALFHSQFQFGGMVVNSQIPITRGYWFLINGGGGNVGYGYGELGLRALLAGNGLAGSKYLTVTAGGVGVFRSGRCDDPFSSCSESLSYGGPMAGVGGEWRF